MRFSQHLSLLQDHAEKKDYLFQHGSDTAGAAHKMWGLGMFSICGALLLTILSQWTCPTGTSRVCVERAEVSLSQGSPARWEPQCQACNGWKAFRAINDHSRQPHWPRKEEGRLGTEGALLSRPLNTASAPTASHVPGLGCSLGSRQLAWA